MGGGVNDEIPTKVGLFYFSVTNSPGNVVTTKVQQGSYSVALKISKDCK